MQGDSCNLGHYWRRIHVLATCSNANGSVRETFSENRSLPEILVWQWFAPYSSCCFTANELGDARKWGRMVFWHVGNEDWRGFTEIRCGEYVIRSFQYVSRWSNCSGCRSAGISASLDRVAPSIDWWEF